MNFLVSIVVPVYNVSKYLEKCIESILKQKYSDIEIILVDDGSTDSSGDICDKYALKYTNIKVVHKTNAGLGMARNTGIEHSTGNFITFVDGDDFISENHILNMIERIRMDKSDACYGGYCKQIGDDFYPQVNPLEGKIYSTNEILHDFIPRMCGKLDYKIVDEVQMSVCMAMFSLKIIKNNCISFNSERKLISEDFVFNLDFLKHVNKISITSSCGYYYRDNANSLTKVYLSDRLAKQKVFSKYIIERTRELGIYEECSQRIYSTFLAWVRNIVKREQRFYKNVGLIQSFKNIKAVCNDDFVIEALTIYDDSNLTKKPALLNKLIRKKKYIMIWLMSYIKENLNF